MSRVSGISVIKLIPEYAGLLGRVCPAAVYEYADAEGADADAEGKKLIINSQVSWLSPLYVRN